MSTVWVAQSDKYKLDIQTKKRHLPVMDRAPLEPPPIVVVVVGPPRIGKSTLISSLVKTYSRQTLTDVKGPVTVVSGGDAWGVHAGLLCSGRVGSIPYGVTARHAPSASVHVIALVSPLVSPLPTGPPVLLPSAGSPPRWGPRSQIWQW